MSAVSFRTSLRTTRAQAVITDVGATGGKIKFYNGTVPATAGTALSGNTLLATGSWASVPIGTATSGTIDFDEASMTQTNSAHVNGTPTFIDLTTSADAVVARISLNVTGGFTFTGVITNGTNFTLTSLVITESNA